MKINHFLSMSNASSLTLTSPHVVDGDEFSRDRLRCHFKASSVQSATKPRLVLTREPALPELRNERLEWTECEESQAMCTRQVAGGRRLILICAENKRPDHRA